MKIVILPAIHTNQAVGIIEDGELPIEIRSPRKLHSGEVELLVSRLYQDVCQYHWELDAFIKHLAWVAPFWAIASIVACYYRSMDLFSLSLGYFIYYTPITMWLMADGIWCLVQVINKVPQWLRARKAFKSLGEHWTAEVVRDGWLAAIEDNRNDWIYRKTATSANPRGFTENLWIECMQYDEQCGHLYKRLLKRYPPRAMDFWPMGLIRWFKRMAGGVPVREPWYVWPVQI